MNNYPINPERVYSIKELDRLTGLGYKNIVRSVRRGDIRAYHLDNTFYAVRGRDFIEALARDERGEVRLSKPMPV